MVRHCVIAHGHGLPCVLISWLLLLPDSVRGKASSSYSPSQPASRSLRLWRTGSDTSLNTLQVSGKYVHHLFLINDSTLCPLRGFLRFSKKYLSFLWTVFTIRFCNGDVFLLWGTDLIVNIILRRLGFKEFVRLHGCKLPPFRNPLFKTTDACLMPKSAAWNRRTDALRILHNIQGVPNRCIHTRLIIFRIISSF